MPAHRQGRRQELEDVVAELDELDDVDVVLDVALDDVPVPEDEEGAAASGFFVALSPVPPDEVPEERESLR